jgi:hypothetical protein
VSELDVDADGESYDILDETLTLFRANTLFRNFEIKGPADRVLIYGILWISECLGKVKPTMSQRDAEKVHTHTYPPFTLPVDMGLGLILGLGLIGKNKTKNKRHSIPPRWTTSLCLVTPRSP